MAATQCGSSAGCREQSQDDYEYHQYDPMIDGVRLSARAKAQCECSDPQKDACHCKGVGGYSSPPRPGLAGEHGKGAHRQEDPAESFDNGGRNDPGFRESQRELYTQVQQRREKKGNGFYNNQNADHRDYGGPATGCGLNHGNFSFELKNQRQTLENLSLGPRTCITNCGAAARTGSRRVPRL